MDNFDESSILKPGKKIKPDFDQTKAKETLSKLYGITALEVCELNSYDDRNFLINADKNIRNPGLKAVCPDGYVLKVLNSLDSRKTGFIEGQTALSLYLSNQKFLCPRQLPDLNGKYYSTLDGNVIRLYDFIPGKIFCDVPPSSNLLYDAGVYLAKLDESLKNFSHDGYNNYKSLWQLPSLVHLEDFCHVVRDESHRDIVEHVIQRFKDEVLTKQESFRQQIIHGDFNEQNILVGKKPGKTEYTVIGFIDFGDTQYSCLVFEIALALTYMLLTSGDIATGGYFLAGYKTIRLIPENEMKVLKLCICARLCQSLVLGLYFHSFDKGNDYLLTTQKAGWKLLEDLYSRTDEEVVTLWNQVADEYLTK